MNAISNPNFEAESLPWLDRYIAEVERYCEDIESQWIPDLRGALVSWLQRGLVIFEDVVPHELIDRYADCVSDFLNDPEEASGVRLTVEGYGVATAGELPKSALSQHHLRIMDFHNASQTGKQLSLLPVIVEFLQHVFRDQVVAMQSLTFIHSTEQSTHQDFPYVASGILSHLAATWIPLEDVHEDAGPLYYYPSSHHIPKFEWGDGLTLTPESDQTPETFASYLDDVCSSYGLTKETFLPKKGDVLFWHAGLVHGGGAVSNPSLTRKSYVTHYSTGTAYPHDRRSPDTVPIIHQINGGLVYGDPLNINQENTYA